MQRCVVISIAYSCYFILNPVLNCIWQNWRNGLQNILTKYWPPVGMWTHIKIFRMHQLFFLNWFIHICLFSIVHYVASFSWFIFIFPLLELDDVFDICFSDSELVSVDGWTFISIVFKFWLPPKNKTFTNKTNYKFGTLNTHANVNEVENNFSILIFHLFSILTEL